MDSFEWVRQHLGPLAIPLTVLSFVVLSILLEKLIVFTVYSFRRRSIDVGSAIWPNRNVSILTFDGLSLLMAHQKEEKSVREEIAEIWLQQRKRRMSMGIRLLQIMAILAPLLGLLGTVLGLITVFDDLSLVSGAIDPSMLAEGLGLAMHTTAAGLIIALPALAAGHGFQMWIDYLILNTEYAMNQVNLMMQGVNLSADIAQGIDVNLDGSNTPVDVSLV